MASPVANARISALEASNMLINLRNQIGTLAGRLTGAIARLRHAKAAKITDAFPGSRWCDHIEREINNQIIDGCPRGGSRWR
ncbi:hypothetical protein [Rhodoblastus sp.]|uniref:hypothetical protein n=1 Tax=Rhodoblastus sp. TaxID=1962975 RepID=UPI0035B28949